MKKFFLNLSIVLLLGLIGCGSSSSSTKEAKELLDKILQVVGIPYDMVVNICQDDNSNGICDIGSEVTSKIFVTRDDTAQTILAKIKLDENGRYILEHFDPTKNILMEIADNGTFNTESHVTLPFTPKPIVKDTPQELSILQ